MKYMSKNGLPLALLLASTALLFSCADMSSKIGFSKNGEQFIFENADIKFVFDPQMRCRVYQKSGDESLTMVRPNDAPHCLVINGQPVRDFVVDEKRVAASDINGDSGRGKRLRLVGVAEGPAGSLIEKTLVVDMYEKFPNAGLFSVEYRNVNATAGLYVDKEINNAFALDASLLDAASDRHAFWLLQGGSYRSRPDWIQSVTDTLSFENYMGKDEAKGESGGGLPALDVWNKKSGFFIGSIRKKPTLISLPARVDEEGYLRIGIEYQRNVPFDRVYRSIPTVVGVHEGDFYNGLRTYAGIMADRGFEMLQPKPSDQVYGAVWCSWGFGPDFTQQQMFDIIPTLKELNFNTATMDDGWFASYGDFIPKKTIFPNGDADMAKLTGVFHEQGFPIKLWFTPGVAGARLMKEHPEWLLRDKDGDIVTVDRFGVKRTAAFLCPALPQVLDYYRDVARLVIGKWDFDGFKMDFEITNAMGECYAAEHGHASPAESFEALPQIYRVIAEESRKLKPKAILEMCPCGMFPSFYKMPFYNQPVASDPNSRWQIRHRGKTIKALMGPHAAFYGDHVERFYSKENFASMVGVGGIPGSKFVAIETDDGFLGKKYPVYLDPERRKNFETWLRIYKENRLSSGEYLNLYDIAYDKPEAHVVRKNGVMYYAFYAPEWNGEVEFRGLDANKYYIIEDYVHHKKLGKINGGGKLDLSFKEYLLVKAVPEK